MMILMQIIKEADISIAEQPQSICIHLYTLETVK